MAKAVYIAYATLKNGEKRTRDFKSSKNAIAWAKQIANEHGACYVERAAGFVSEVVFDTEISEEKACT
jgi:hypothetical protein